MSNALPIADVEWSRPQSVDDLPELGRRSEIQGDQIRQQSADISIEAGDDNGDVLRIPTAKPGHCILRSSER